MHETATADYDRCGWGTEHGCKEEIETTDIILVLNAAVPEDAWDNGHRMYHTRCAPPGLVPMTEQRRRKLNLIRAR